MSYLESYLDRIRNRGNPGLAGAIKKTVEDELKRREEAKLEELKRRENAAAILQKKRDREEYERLKKIFEGE